jgi:hypothetical protein
MKPTRTISRPLSLWDRGQLYVLRRPGATGLKAPSADSWRAFLASERRTFARTIGAPMRGESCRRSSDSVEPR